MPFSDSPASLVNEVNGREEKIKLYDSTGWPHFSLQLINYNDKEYASLHENALQFPVGMTSLRRRLGRTSDQIPRSLLQKFPLTPLAKAILPTKSWWCPCTNTSRARAGFQYLPVM